MATFVFVPGAWHASRCWERVVPLLEAGGHRTVAPDLVGTGADTTPMSAITLSAWADQIAAMVSAETEPVILVGHSRGGLVISEVAERVPERIRSLVYLAAYLVPDGESLVTREGKFDRQDGGDNLLPHLIPGADGTTTVNPDAAGRFFYNTTEAYWIKKAIAQLGPEPMVTFDNPVQISQERFGSVPRSYIHCSEDNSLPLALQHEMQAALTCNPVFTLATDHSPFYSNPSALVACLQSIVAFTLDHAQE